MAIQALENAGFKPIIIAGMYGRGPINFMNAIVQKNDDGLIYITNGVKNESELFNAFQDEFEEVLLRKCPQIKRIHFVGGELVGKDLNDMMIYLKNYHVKLLLFLYFYLVIYKKHMFIHKCKLLRVYDSSLPI